MAEIDPGEVGSTAIVGTGLVPLGGIQRAGIELARLIGDEAVETDIGAVVGQVDGLAVRHHRAELVREPPHGVVLAGTGLAVVAQCDLGDVAVGVGVEDLPERGDVVLGRIEPEIHGHRRRVLLELLQLVD